MFEMILNSGTRNTTYKFGLLTSIVDYVIENPLERPMNNFHFIPLFYLSKQFLAYYYPLILEGVRQGPKTENKSSTKIKNFILGFQNSIEAQKKLPFALDIENTNTLISHINSDLLTNEILKLLFYIRKIVIDQPLQHILKVKDNRISLFGLLSASNPFQSDFEEHRKTGYKLKWSELKTITNWNELLQMENLFVFVSHQTYKEISDIRFWLRDVIIKRWSQECIEKFDAQSTILLSLFDFWKRIPERDNSVIKKYKALYLENELNHCINCNQDLKSNLILDHLFPWSRFPNNSFWNLYPVCKSCNSKKSDKIPKINKKIANQISNHIDICLRENNDKSDIILNDLKQLYKHRIRVSSVKSEDKSTTEEILTYIKEISHNLLETIPGYEF